MPDRELLRVVLHDEDRIEVTLTPWCEKVATRRKVAKVVTEIGRHVRRAIGPHWLDGFRRTNRTELQLLRFAINEDGFTDARVAIADEHLARSWPRTSSRR